MFRVIPAPVCVDATYRRPLIAIGARRGPPGTRFVFSVDVVGWNDYVPLFFEDLAKVLTYLRRSMLPRIAAVFHLSKARQDASTSAKRLGCRGCSVMWLHVVVLCRSFTCSQMFPGLCVVTNVTNCTLPALNASPPSRCDESFTFSGLNTLSPPILLPNTRHDVSTAAQWVEDVVDVAQTRGMS